jgi:hypothetical protein
MVRPLAVTQRGPEKRKAAYNVMLGIVGSDCLTDEHSTHTSCINTGTWSEEKRRTNCPSNRREHKRIRGVILNDVITILCSNAFSAITWRDTHAHLIGTEAMGIPMERKAGIYEDEPGERAPDPSGVAAPLLWPFLLSSGPSIDFTAGVCTPSITKHAHECHR